MNKAETMVGNDERDARPVFVSYATADRKKALAVCKAVERRGTRCWISSRDVAPGENYQEAIVRSIRTAPALVLVFSEAANNSDEIKKELSLASKHKLPVLALRIEDVEPSDAFAYELSTRQWIDAFEGWDKSIDALVGRIAALEQTDRSGAVAATAPARLAPLVPTRRVWMAAAAFILVVIAGGIWWALRPPAAAAHPMTVRLAGFQSLSPALPATMPAALNSEITAAFNADGVIAVSSATAPGAGSSPAYSLGGTIDRIGDSVRVIIRLTDERSGSVVWSASQDYGADHASRVPHWTAVNVGTVVRCGLFGASTYRKPLPDAVLGNYMQYCQQYWAFAGSKTLRYAQLVVAAVPDFSWGWSGVANGYLQSAQTEADDRRRDHMLAAGRDAEDKALALDPGNGEALAHKAYMIDPRDWLGQESLLKRAIAAKPLDCGCEHYGYGLLLERVGRLDDAAEQFRKATDMLSLWPDSEFALGRALVAIDRLEEAKPHFESASDLSTEPAFGPSAAASEGVETGDYAAALRALRNPEVESPEIRAILVSGYEALSSGDTAAKAQAIKRILAAAKDQQASRLAPMLAALGATHEALQLAGSQTSLFWRRSMRATLDDPSFPAVARKLGLIHYWKATDSRPDVCAETKAPRFCAMI